MRCTTKEERLFILCLHKRKLDVNNGIKSLVSYIWDSVMARSIAAGE